MTCNTCKANKVCDHNVYGIDMDFKVGDYVYASDWCYGVIVDIKGKIADVEFETAGGGGTLPFELSELMHDKSKISKRRIES